MQADRGGMAGLLAAHSWLGLISSWILALVFLTGAMTMFQQEIDLWEKAPASLGSEAVPGVSLDHVLDALIIPATVKDKRVEVLLPGYKNSFYHIYVYDSDGDYYRGHAFHPVTGAEWPDPDLTGLAEFLEEFHKRLLVDQGRYIVGAATFISLLNILSGLILYWPKLSWRSLVRPRLGKLRLRWLDLHVSIGVFTLPFLLVIIFTGALFSFSAMLQTGLLAGRLQEKPAALAALLFPEPPVGPLADKAMRIVGTDALIADAAHRTDMVPTRISLRHFGDRSATMTVFGERRGSFSAEVRITYRLSDRAVVQQDSTGNVLAHGQSTLQRLHYGDFGGFLVRLLYFLLAAAGCFLIMTGNLLWLEKRIALNRRPRGLRVVSALSVGTCGGGMLALAGTMVAARLLPSDWPERADMVAGSFIGLLICAQIAAFVMGRRPRQILVGFLIVATALYMAVPVLDWIAFGPAIAAQARNSGAIILLEGLCILVGMACVSASIWLRRDAARTPR